MNLTECDFLEQRWTRLEQLCQGIPPTLVHLDLKEKNFRLRTPTHGTAPLASDWELAKPFHSRFPWLGELCLQRRKLFAPLLVAPPTVIHREFHINNILVRRQQVFPVDWESAAVAAGEIDLPALIEGPWIGQVIQRCVREYRRSRWPQGAPASFGHTLDAARLYLHFRWLGEREDWTLHEKNRWRFQQLRLVARRQGLLGDWLRRQFGEDHAGQRGNGFNACGRRRHIQLIRLEQQDVTRQQDNALRVRQGQVALRI